MKSVCEMSISIVPALLAVTILLIAPPALNAQRALDLRTAGLRQTAR